MALNSLCGFFVPIKNLRAVPRRYPRSAQDLFKSTPDMANSVRHTRQIAVHGDRHDLLRRTPRRGIQNDPSHADPFGRRDGSGAS